MDSKILQPLLERLPFITLPLVILLAFSSPPFRGRGILFAALIIANDCLCTFSQWPPNAGATRPMRYGMAGSWTFVLPALERLLLHVPENDFWLLDKEDLANNGRPRELTWDKVRWAAHLVTTPRAVGWNFGQRRTGVSRASLTHHPVDRLRFPILKLGRAGLAYITLDTVVFAAQNTLIPTSWAWDIDTLKRIVYVETLMLISVYSTMTMQFELAALVAVVFFPGSPDVRVSIVLADSLLILPGLASSVREPFRMLYYRQRLGQILARLYPPSKPTYFCCNIA
ncbi:hypothetical protein FZEAL_2569 [Fusarium zealandicum]|uniref:Wax synthase domain-containing protein n=1 Tax=Fusarium zealandicum TaxID=1053134 RepID=A0A8H4UQS9_9HYPO|nr:hypothetical protein FZEAL_2569 [Fusarium zealandicum]